MTDPRGPYRKIISVEMTTTEAKVMLSCGHVRSLNQTFSYRVGDNANCYACREEKCGQCGSVKPVGQSCGCFDNNCQ